MLIFSYFTLLFIAIFIWCVDYFIYRRNWYDPLYLFLFFILLYISPLSLRYINSLPVEGNVTKYFYEIESIYPYSLLFVSLGMIIFYFSYLYSPVISLKISIKENFLSLNLAGYKLLKLIGYLYVFFGIVSFILISNEYGGVKNVILMGYGVTEVFSRQPLLPISLSIISTATFIFLVQYSIFKYKFDFFISILIIVLVIFFNIILGRRAEIAVWGMSYVIFYSILIRRVSFKIIFPVILSGFLFLNIIGLARNANYENIDVFFDSVSKQISSVKENSNGMFYTLTTGQFVVPFETLPILMLKLEKDDLYFGSTLFNIFTQWIPRSMYINKDYGIGQWYYQKFYDPIAPPNEGRQFFFLSEGYLNFGYLGIILWSLLWGFFWKNISALKNNKRYNNRNILGYFIFSIYSGAMIILVAGDSVSMFVALVKSNILWFLSAYIISKILCQLKLN